MAEQKDLFEQTKEQVEGMLKLLNDPHPGLITWHTALVDRFKKLAALFDCEITWRK